MNAHDPILAKVRKLLALAEDPAATEHEAQACTAKAAALIADYGIDQALLAADRPDSDPVRDLRVALDPPYAADKADLLSTVAQRLRCRCVLLTRRGGGSRELAMHVFGHRSDLERTELLFTSLLVQSALAMARTPVPPFDNAAAFRRSWLAGFRLAVGDRLDASERAAEAQAAQRHATSRASTSLVLADRTAAVETAVEDAYPQARPARPRQLSGGGLGEGFGAGLRADLGQPGLSGGRRGLQAPS